MKSRYFWLITALFLLACGQTTLGAVGNTPVPLPTAQNASQDVKSELEISPTATKTDARVFIVSADVLRIRAEPSTDSDVLAYVTKGMELKDAGDMKAGVGDCTQWAAVRWEDVTAWVCASFVYPR